MTADTPPTEPGRQLGRYTLLHCLASGGMAELYLARLSGEEGFERVVAVKVIHPYLTRQPQFVKMFIDEARLVSRISHPNVALTLDLGRVGETHFIAMEYVNGESLAMLLRSTRPPVPYSVRIISDAAAGLHAAHELGGPEGAPLNVVHRDVSPQNLLISYEGAVKVVDFGVARARGSLHTTSKGEVKGKFSYMSPEQIRTPEQVDRRTDIFALGIMLYEMTTWKRLFRAENEAAVIERVLRCEVPPPTRIVPDYPRDLERIVLRALQRDPDLRHHTAQELHDELEHFIVDTGEPVSSSTLSRMMRGVFAARIEEKQTLIEARGAVQTTTFPEVERSTATSLDMRPSLKTFRPRRRQVVMGLAGLLVVLAGVSVLVLRGMGPGERSAQDAAARDGHTSSPALAGGEGDAGPRAPDATPRLVSIAASADPPGATLVLDGKPMTNPFEVRRAAGEGTIELVISARGHRPQRFQVPLSRRGTWTVGLVPLRQTRRPRPKRGSSYLDNPYQQE